MADQENELTFGNLLKQLRLEEAQLGLRAFANLIDVKPSNLSNWERDRANPPASKKKIDEICAALGLSETDPRRDQLFDLAASASNRIPADVAEAVKTQAGVPVFVRTIANRQLSDEKIVELTEYIKKFY